MSLSTTTNNGIEMIPDEFTSIPNGNELDKQFVPETPAPRRDVSRKISRNELYDTYNKISGNMLNIQNAINELRKKENELKEQSNKVSTKAQKIIDENNRRRQEEECNKTIKCMISHRSDIINNYTPTIGSLKGLLSNYKTKAGNYIMRIIIIQAIIIKYTNTNDDSIIPLIFKLLMILNKSKNMWNNSREYENKEKVVSHDNTLKKSNRQIHREKQNIKLISDFEIPTINELINFNPDLPGLGLSDRIKNAIIIATNQAKDIITKKNIDIIQYQMVETFDTLDDNWDEEKIKLDDWQLEVIDGIDKNKTIIVSVPTGTGKTVCAQYCVVASTQNTQSTIIDNDKVLFIVPTTPLALQVAGSFHNIGMTVALSTDTEDYNILDNVRVYVCTPTKAENLINMLDLNKKLRYVVFDEIHTINEKPALERILKIIDCPFLILSATMNEPEKFKNYISNIIGNDKDILLIKHNKRSIVQQKMIWDGTKMINVNPISSIDLDYIRVDQFKTGDVAMTSRDLYELGLKLSTIFPEFDAQIHPNKYFDENIPLTSTKILEYETHLKNFMVRMAFIDSAKIQQLLDTYLFNSDIWTESNILIQNIINLFQALKNNNMLPGLIFMMNDVAIIDVYTEVIKQLEQMEKYYFPWYQPLMESWYKKIVEFVFSEAKRKESIAKGLPYGTRREQQIKDRISNENKEFLENFLCDLKNVYNNEFQKTIDSKIYSEQEKKIICDFITKDYNEKYTRYYSDQINNSVIELPRFNPYCPTSMFSFHNVPFSKTDMIGIINDMTKFSSAIADKKVTGNFDYTNIFIRGIERGIVLHSNILPIYFQRIVQKLVSNRRCPICFGDNSLRYGLNLPVRTVVILGRDHFETISTIDAQQMGGRSGRRGYDSKGNIVFYRVNFPSVLRGTYPPLLGCESSLTPYVYLPAKIFNGIAPNYIQRITKNPLKYYMTNKTDWEIEKVYDQIKTCYNESSIYDHAPHMLCLIWLFRDDVAVAPNLFPMITRLLVMGTNKFNKIQIGMDEKHPYYDDETLDKFGLTKKNRYIYELQPVLLIQIIELLVRVLDREESEEEIIDLIDSEFVSKDRAFIEMLLNETIWPYPLRFTNTDFIRKIALNESFDNITIEQKTSYIIRLENLCNRIMNIYNFFADIGSMMILNILDHPMTVIVNKLNNLKTLNN